MADALSALRRKVPTASVALSIGEGGLQKLVLQHGSGSSAEIYLWGATLTSYKSANGKEHIFVSPGAIWDGKKAIRGGVPVVFPQFGQPDKSMPQHGFVRTTMWEVARMSERDSVVTATLTTSSSKETKEKWPHDFLLEYTVVLASNFLQMRLLVRNQGSAPFDFQALLHTYLEVPDAGDVGVRGLKGRKYIDKVANGEEKSEDSEEVNFPKFTDRVYVGADRGPIALTVGKRSQTVGHKSDPIFAVACEGCANGVELPCDVVCWNPYEEASPGDLPVPAYKRFVCVEPGLVAAFHTLPPGASAEVAQSICPILGCL